MANWCKTEYTFTGDRKSLEGIYALMHGLEETEVPEEENDFGTSWLGRIATALGRDWQTIKCRGSWEDICLSDETLTFTTWTAWQPPYELMELLKLKYPGVEYFYFGEEPGNGFFETNDKEGRFYPVRYIAYYDNGEEEHMFRCATTEEMLDCINRLSDKNFKNIEEVNSYYQHLSETDDNSIFCHINEVSVIETNEAHTLYFDDSGIGRLVRPDGTIVAVAELIIKS